MPAAAPRPEITIYAGGLYASREPAVIKTLVGSCIAVCLIDQRAGVGGMNHFLLPASTTADAARDAARFGVHAMELLIGAIQKAGGERARLQAKIFGAANVLEVASRGESIGEQNIRFITGFLKAERIATASCDLGGYLPRRVHFHTETGKAFVKRLGEQALKITRLEERRVLRDLDGDRAYGDVWMFDKAAGAREGRV